MEFAEYLRKLRTDKKMSIRQLAMYSGVSHTYLSQIENKERGVPKPEILKKLADPLGVTYELLMSKAGYWKDKQIEGVVLSRIYEYDNILNKKIYDLLKRIANDEGKFPVELHGEIFGIFGGWLPLYPNEQHNFDRWYMDYLNVDNEDKSDSDENYAFDEFNKYYNLPNMMYGLNNYKGIKKSREDFLNELEPLIERYFKNERDLINNLNLSDDKLLERFTVTLDGEELTPDEFLGLLAFVRANRQLKNDIDK